MSLIRLERLSRELDDDSCYAYSSIKKLVALVTSPPDNCSGTKSNAGTNAFGHIIKGGQTILLKPNWVFDRNFSGESMQCMITNHEVLKATIELLLEKKPKKIIIADAPIQLCHFPNLIPDDLGTFIKDLSISSGIPIHIVDLRNTVASSTNLVDGFKEDVRSKDRYVEFNLGSSSFLEGVTGWLPSFRITNYDPRKTARSHRKGHHRYVIAKEIFEADVIISLPKLKTHRKAGLTGALKNFVGINGNKECLAHHRIGGSFIGGDCYRGFSISKFIAELLLDQANKCIGKTGYRQWKRWSERFVGIARKLREGSDLEGSWYGNDTVWRMVLDINRIVFFGDCKGNISKKPRNNIYYLTDAIVIGEGEGPLAPTSKYLGYLTFSHSPLVDILHAKLMGYEWSKIPLLVNAAKLFSPLNGFQNDLSSLEVFIDDKVLPLRLFPENTLDPAIPPIGWKGYIEA